MLENESGLTVKEGPEDAVRESVVVPLGNFCREVHWDAREVCLELFRDEIPIDFGNVEPCVRN